MSAGSVAIQGGIVRRRRGVSNEIEDDCYSIGILLGAFGIHKFYLGRPGQGIATILTLGGFLGIWPFINFIQYILMSNDDFHQKYN